MQKPVITDPSDYWKIIKRRKNHFVVPFTITLLLSIMLAYSLPKLYKSTATIQIEQQEIPDDVVSTPGSGYIDEHLERLSQRVLTKSNLLAIIKSMHLYVYDGKSSVDDDVLVDKMRDNIKREMVNVDVNGPRGQGTATIAFTISYDGKTPEISQKVTEKLATLFLDENRKARTEQVTDVSDFLSKEADKLNKQISVLEQKMADFKQRNVSQLPEMSDLNYRMLERTQDQLQQSENTVQTLTDRIIQLQAQLAQLDPNMPLYMNNGNRVLTPSQRLAELRAKYLSASAIYSPDYPDLVKMRREINTLEKSLGVVSPRDAIKSELDIDRAKLEELKQKYSDEYPDVKKLQSRVTTLEKKLKASPKNSKITIQDQAVAPDNPAYITIKAQLDSARSNLQMEQENQKNLRKKLVEYQKRIFETPAVEREYLLLTRDHQNALKKYNEIKDKQMQAQLAVQVEKHGKAERFSLIEPATLPKKPDKPNRLGIVLLGTLLAFSGGIGFVTMTEYSDKSVRGIKTIKDIFQAPPLAVIPNMQGAKKRNTLVNRAA